MSAEAVNFVPLAIISAVAFAAPIVRRRLLPIVPVAVLEIVAGILLGRSGLQVIHVAPAVHLLALFGFAYLMFLSGLEVDLRLFTATGGETGGRISRVVRNPFYASVLLCGLTLLSALAFAFYMTHLGWAKDPWLMTLILSTTSLGVVVPTLKERYLTETPIGQTILLTAALKDFVTILLIAVYATLVSTGLSLKITSVLFLVIGFVLALRASAALQRTPFLRRLFDELGDVVSQLHVRGSLLLLFIFAAFAELLGVEVILGAFVAGVVVSSVSQERGSEIRMKLDTIGYGFVLSFFFVDVGANFNLAALRSSPEMIVAMMVLLVGCYAVKVLPALVLLIAYPWRKAIGAGVLLSARLSFILAVAAVALNLGIIGEAMQSAIVLIVVATCSTAPVMFNWLVPSHAEAVATLGFQKRGVPGETNREADLMALIPVREALTHRLLWVPEEMTVAEFLRRSTEEQHEWFPVLNQAGQLNGVVTAQDVQEALGNGDMHAKVGDLATTELVTVTPNETLRDVLVRFHVRDLGHLPVVDPENPKKLVGIISRLHVIRAYNRALIEKHLR